MEKSDKIIAYISQNGEVKSTHAYQMGNVNHHKELLLLLHKIAVGMEKGMRVTFTTEV